MKIKKVQNFWNGNVKSIYGVKDFKNKKLVKFYEEARHIRFGIEHGYLPKLANFKSFKDQKVLEIGVGMGVDAVEIARSGAKYNGVDLSKTSLENTKQLFKEFGLKGNFKLTNAEKLPFKDNQFDIVYSCGVLHHTPKTNQAIREVYRVLKPGGKAIIMLYHKNSFHYYVEIVMFRHIICGNFLKQSLQQTLNENTDGRNNPLSKVYSRKDVLRVFKGFKNIKTKARFLTLPSLLDNMLSEKTKNKLAKIIGWDYYVFATK